MGDDGENSQSRLKLRQGGKRPVDYPLVFLDFDGVLNNEGSILAFGTPHTFDPVAVGLVRRLCEESGAKIVVSSSWRPSNRGQLNKLTDNMRRAGAGELIRFVIGYTDRLLNGIRGAEVAKFRRDNHHNGAFVIIDDDCDFFPGQPIIQTSQGRGFGLCEYIKCMEILYPLHLDIERTGRYVGMKLGGQRLEAGHYDERTLAR